MELFKKYIPHISLGVGVLVVLTLFIESVTVKVGALPIVSFMGLNAAFGSSGDYSFGANYALILAYVLPLVAGLLHFFTQKLSHAKIYQYIYYPICFSCSLILCSTCFIQINQV